MEEITDWIRLWRELVEVRSHKRQEDQDRDPTGQGDIWRARARDYQAHLQRRWAQPDSTRSFVTGWLQAHPGATVLDIGAGTGAWSALLARHARSVTAVEPSPAMIGVMEENLAAEKITNVQIVQGAWPDVEVPPHDVTLCSHAMYGYPDLPLFVRRLVMATNRICFLVLRAATADGLMAEAAMRIWGHPYDSPNFQVAYNILLQMGILANVLVEDSGSWSPWTSDSLEEALSKIKRRFGLGQVSDYDEFLAGLLRERLTYRDGQYVWPPGAHSALVYW